MGLNLSYYDAMLKEFYGTALQETLNNEVLLLKYLQKSSRAYDGRRVVFPSHVGRNLSTMARAEGGALPLAGQQSSVSVAVTAAYIYSRIELTGQVMKAAGKTAFADALSSEMEGVKTDAAFTLGRQSYGEGVAILGQVGTSADTSTLYLVNQFAEPGAPGARYLSVGQQVQVGSYEMSTGDSAGSVSGVEVVTITLAANSGTTYDTVTVTGTVTTSASDFVMAYLGLASAVTPRGYEVVGLRAIVDDTTQTNCYGGTGGFYGEDSIYGIARSTYKTWNAYVTANSGTERVLDSYLLQKTLSNIKKASGKDANIFFGEYDVLDAFWDSVAGDRRFNSKNFDAGVDTLTFNGKTMVKDLLAPYNELFCLNSDALKWYVLEDFGFSDEDGSVLKNVSGYDKYEAFLRFFGNLGPSEMCAFNATGAIRDIKTRL